MRRPEKRNPGPFLNYLDEFLAKKGQFGSQVDQSSFHPLGDVPPCEAATTLSDYGCRRHT